MRGPNWSCFLLLNFVIVPLSAAQQRNRTKPKRIPSATVSTPATLDAGVIYNSKTGVLVRVTHLSSHHATAFNEVLKLSVTPRLEFIASGEPLRSLSCR